ncbi:MMPL family transporter [Candidatus Binatia bacterium]|nr:MMPL family transporter [Candidatus Binatia bacterium]
MGSGIGRLFVEVDPDRQLPQSNPYIIALNEAHRLFGDKNLVMVGIQPVEGDAFSPHCLSKIAEITEGLGAIPGAVQPLLLSISSTSAKHVHRQENGEVVIEQLMPRIPTSPAEAQLIKTRVLDDPFNIGVLVSPDASALAIYATFELSPKLPGYVQLHRAIEDILRSADDGSFRYSVSGVVAVSAAMTAHTARIAYFFPIALFVIGLVHYHAFRTWQAVVLPLLTGLLAVIWALGLMGHLSVALDPFNATTPVLILAIGAGHAVQILKRYYEELPTAATNEDAIVLSLAHVGPVMIAAATIASLSFFSLATLGTESIRTFGLFTGFGIVSALAVELTIIPALRACLGRPVDASRTAEAEASPWLSDILATMATRLANRTGALVGTLAYAILLAMTVLLSRNLVIDTSLKQSFAQTDPIRSGDDWLNSKFAGTNTLLFLIEGPHEGALAEPAALEAIDRLERAVEGIDGVGKAFSVLDILKRLHGALAEGGAHSELPPSKEAALQYLFLYSLSSGEALTSFVTPDYRIAKITVMLHEDNTSYGEQVIGAARMIASQTLPPGFSMRVAGTLASNAALSHSVVRGKLLNIAQISLATIVISAAVLRSLLGGLLVAVPLTVAVLVNFGAMGALGIRLDITTAIVTAMAVGIGADYAVYFLFRLREEVARGRTFEAALIRSVETSGKAILFVSTAVAAGYAVLCLSGFRAFEQLGLLVALSMVSSSMATLIAIPSMLTLIARTRWIQPILGKAIAGDEYTSGDTREPFRHSAGGPT